MAMRAALITRPGQTDFVSRHRPEPGPGHVRVAIEGCGVCGSNLPVWQGRPWFQYPLAPGAPGHEPWGHVDALGDDVEGISVGTRVALLCEQGFAEAAVVPASAVVPIDGLRADAPFPGEALGCGFNVAARSDFAPGQTVAVVGVGFLGAIVTARAAAAGATVVAVSRRPFALEVAALMGAHHTIELGDPDLVVHQV